MAPELQFEPRSVDQYKAMSGAELMAENKRLGEIRQLIRLEQKLLIPFMDMKIKAEAERAKAAAATKKAEALEKGEQPPPSQTIQQ